MEVDDMWDDEEDLAPFADRRIRRKDMTNWHNADEREAAMAAKWAEAEDKVYVLREALEVAEQFMSIASDWNMDEAEINGEMRSTYDWLDVVRAALEATK